MRVKHLVLTALLLVGLTSTAWAGNLTVNGSTTILPIMQKAVEAFMVKNPGINVSVAGGGSSNGIKALMDGSCDIAMASRKMKGKEKKAAAEKGVTPVEYVVALDALLPIVNPANPVSDLTREQLQGIFAGKITNWKEVGGADDSIVVISRDTSSGTYGTWKDMIMKHNKKKEKVTPRALLLASSGTVLTEVAKNKKAIAYDGIGYVDETVKGLKVEGVTGSMATVYDGSFPLGRELQVYTAGEAKGDAKKLVDFLLSAEGQKITEEVGFIPLKK